MLPPGRGYIWKSQYAKLCTRVFATLWSLPTTQGLLRLKILIIGNRGVCMTTEVVKKEGRSILHIKRD